MLDQISGIAFRDMGAEREHEGFFALSDEIINHGRPYCEKVPHLICIVGEELVIPHALRGTM